MIFYYVFNTFFYPHFSLYYCNFPSYLPGSRLLEGPVPISDSWCFFLVCLPICFFTFFLLLFKYSFLHFPATTPNHPSHSHFPPLIPPVLVSSMCPSSIFLKIPAPFPLFIPTHFPSGYCQFVPNFTDSGNILLACLFC